MNITETLINAVNHAATDRDGRKVLACAEAFRIAADLSMSKESVGNCCNDLGIKIVHCQLGCFK